jgi:hypothetical protein
MPIGGDTKEKAQPFGETTMNKLIQACLLAAGCLVPLSVAKAQAPTIQKGTYHGSWQGGKMRLTIEKVSGEKFSGIVHMDKESEWPSLKFDIKGEANADGTLTIRRVNDEWDQSVTAKPNGEGKEKHWKGILKGPGTDEKKHFEVRIPQ